MRLRIFLTIWLTALSWNVSVLVGQPAADPRLVFATYLGGTSAETVTVVRTDREGNMYLAGATRSTDFPAGRSLFSPPNPPTTFEVGFLTKLSASGALVYSTYLPRPVVAIAVDVTGHAIVVDNMPFSTSRFSGPLGDVVVSKVNPSGTELLYSVRLAGSRLEQATGIAADDTGAVVVVGHSTSPDFPLVNQLQPIIQSASGQDKSAFVTKLDAHGRIVFSTGWGGSNEDAATAVAIDRRRHIYVGGMTGSPDFITSDEAFRRSVIANCPYGSACPDVFVTKLMPDGQAIVYSTLFGGSKAETLRALAVDDAGNVHVAGTASSSDLPLVRARQSGCDDTREIYGCSSYVAKLNPGGSSLEYATYFGSQAYYVGGLGQTINDLAIDSEGRLLLVGTTQGNDLPLVSPLQSVNGGGPVFKSANDGQSWTSASSGLTGTGIWALAGEGLRPPRFYASTFGQIFHSEDHGLTWRGQRGGSTGPNSAIRIAVDPRTPSTVYAADAVNGALKSVDGGETWTTLPLEARQIYDIAIAPSSPSHLYVAALRGVYHSPNGGLTWELVLDINPEESTRSRPTLVVVDPREAQTIYVALSDTTLLRRSGSQQAERVEPLPCPTNELVAAADSILYARACGKLFQSTDSARSWRELNIVPGYVGDIALDPSRPNALYIAASVKGLRRSIDRGESWLDIGVGSDHDFRTILVDPLMPGTIYAGATAASNAFVVRFDTSGEITFSTYLGGRHSAGASVTAHPDGSMVVGGVTASAFPLARPIQSTYRGENDAFLARIVVDR